MTKYSTRMLSTESTACRLRNLDGARDIRKPVSIKVRNTAASSSKGMIPIAPTKGAVQRYPETHAINVPAGSSVSSPMRLAIARSISRLHSSNGMRIGKVTSHSKSQSGCASSRVAKAPRMATTNSSDHSIASPRAIASLSTPDGVAKREPSMGSKARCRLMMLCRAMLP